MIKAAIFDMDGTLTDTERLYQETWVILAEQFGQVNNPAFPLAVCGRSGEKMLETIREFYPEVDAEAFMQAGLMRVEEIVRTKVPLKEGAAEILPFLKERGFKLAIASGSKRELIEYSMKSVGLWQYFDAIVGADDVSKSKPDPEIFLKAAEAIGMRPEECYAFEDGLNGLRSCQTAGCKSIMVVDLTQPDDEVAPRCVGIFNSLVEAKEAIERGEV